MCSRDEVKQEVQASEKRVLLKIDAMFSDFRKEIEDNVYIKYNQAIEQVHNTAPETKKKLDAIELSLADHVSKEEKYWDKIDAMHDFMSENRTLILNGNKKIEDALEYLPAMKVVADLLTGGRVMGWFGRGILWVAGILGAIYYLRDVFRKE